MARHYLLMIDSFIDEIFKLIEEFKGLHSLKSIRRRDMLQRTTMIDEIFNRDFKIDELNKK